MLLTVKDRLIIQTILPREDNFITIALCRDLAEKVRLSQEMMDGCKMHYDEKAGMTAWDDKLADAFSTEVVFTQAEMELFFRVIKDMDIEKRITQDNFDTLKKLRDAMPEKTEKKS